ncbi:MAG TPA: hypothetical protein VM864_08215 [Pyrinomonadaceae bacterium]|jgi:hypothetical protein|nr:hypothetical protein [Pyrinomonadaceae bacterium]
MLSRIFDYVNHVAGEGQYRLSEIYGTECFCWFLHSVILMRKPQTIVELGTGAACTTSLAALAAKLNQHGHVWTVDDGSDWELLREDCQRAAGYVNPDESYEQFVAGLLRTFGLSDYVTHVAQTVSGGSYFAPRQPIDILFLDLGDTGPLGCLKALRYYLPKVARSSSIFIDRASTILPSRLLLESIVSSLDRGKVPRSLINGLDPAAVECIESLAGACRFKLIDLVESRRGKANVLQNSRLWISIEVEDSFPPEDVDVFIDGGAKKPIRLTRQRRKK